jgi:pyruvate,water dikinase
VLARFDELYANARCYLAIDEDHNLYIDQMGNAGLRLPILEMGRRLARYSAIAAPGDVFQLHLDEIGAGMSGVDQRATVGARQADLRRWAAVVPPDTLGVPPSDDVTDPLLAALSKQDTAPGARTANGAGVITGTPASPGVASGTARVARSLNEACAAQPGEVLVCEMTLPTWTPLFATVAAVVSDTGGVLSHCAIVARELGIPCVVGTQVGTHTIENGMLLTVDGSRGTVQIQQRPIKPSGRS